MGFQGSSRASLPDGAAARRVSGTNGNRSYLGLGSLFEPDILTTSRYRATYQRRFHLEPERMLMLAVLEDAIVCFQENVAAVASKRKALFREAEEWILNEENSYLYSFENICDDLGFEPFYLRRGLMRWKETALAQSTTKMLAQRTAK
jgi:hypothetical protein